MTQKYTLLMQKTTANSQLKSSLEDFGFAVCDLPWPEEKIKEVAKRDWPGEHGEDVYLPPSGLKLQSYEIEAEFCYKGELDTAADAYTVFRNYLLGASGDGVELSIYDPYWAKDRTGVYLLEISDLSTIRSAVDEAVAFKAKFSVSKPMATVLAVRNEGEDIINLSVA